MLDPLSTLGTVALLKFFMPKVLTATVCGALVGLERERKNKTAGIKTNILICVGATLFTAISFTIGDIVPGVDPTRIMSYILSGIGFLGGGVIFKNADKVHGMTTAAIIWVMSAIGMIIGAGGYGLGLCMTLGMILMTVCVQYIERKYLDDQR